MSSYLQLETASDYDLTIGFNKGAYAVATSVELDASQGTTADWIHAMPTQMQSFFVSAYLPQFTEDFSVTVLAAPTASVSASAYPSTVPSYAAALATSSSVPEPFIQRELRPGQSALSTGLTTDSDNRTVVAIVITLSFLILFGGCVAVFCWVRSIRSRTSETSGSLQTEHAELNDSHSVAATMSQTSLRTEPVNFHGHFSNSEASVSRHLNSSGTRFLLGSSVGSNTSTSSSSSSDEERTVDLISLDDPFSDTAIISSLARENTPAASPSQVDARHDDFSHTG